MSQLVAFFHWRPALAALSFAVGLQHGATAAADLGVVVTSKPIHALVSGVMGSAGQPRLLVDGTASPHSYAMKPSDAAAVQKAQVLFRISESIEPFTAKLVQVLPKSVQLVSLEAAPGVERLKRRTGGAFEREAAGHAHGHGHGHGKSATMDGHVWLDPANAKAMVAEIAKVLAKLAPGAAATFSENANTVAAGIDALDREIADELAPLKGKSFVVFHDAFQYFERRYGLSAIGSITLSPDEQPSAKRLNDLRRRIAALNAECVFSEPTMNAGIVKAVAEGSRARIGMLDPEALGIDPGPAAYTSLMRGLAAGFKACLGAGR